jgi:hypothetical protein
MNLIYSDPKIKVSREQIVDLFKYAGDDACRDCVDGCYGFWVTTFLVVEVVEAARQEFTENVVNELTSLPPLKRIFVYSE